LPYVESRKLRDALAQRPLRLHYAEVNIFDHLVPAVPSNPLNLLGDLPQFLYYVYRLLFSLL